MTDTAKLISIATATLTKYEVWRFPYIERFLITDIIAFSRGPLMIVIPKANIQRTIDITYHDY